MAADTKIEWADHTFNPWIGCTKVSPGCDNCYAKAEWDDRRHRAVWGPGNPRSRTKTWGDPVRWNDQHEAFFAQHDRRQRVFCASLADVFDNEVPVEWRHELFNLIAATPNLDWLLLTKRPQNIVRMVQDHGCLAGNGMRYLPGNVWLGATTEDQKRADQNVLALLYAKEQTGAKFAFLSMEPLLGPVNLRHLNEDRETFEVDCLKPYTWSEEIAAWKDTEEGWEESFEDHYGVELSGLDPAKAMHATVDWVIVGGESGPSARPMHPDWARSLRDQCQAAGVPFFFKQHGEWLAINQQEEAFTNQLYRSNRKAEHHEDQGNLDGLYGRTCTVPHGVVHLDGSLHDLLEPMAFLQGTGAMTTFKVGKKNAGRLLDGRTWDEVPA